MVVRNCLISRRYIFYRYIQIFTPFCEIMITRWDIFLDFGFYCMRFNRGMFLNGEFLRNGRPWTLRVVFFFFTTMHLFPCSNKRRRGFINTKSRGSMAILFSLQRTSPTSWWTSASYFFNQSTANGIPVNTRIVPMLLPICA